MDNVLEHEFLLIKKLIVKERQKRYLNLLATQKGRIKFRSYIAHFRDLNPDYCIPLNNLKTSNQLYDLLKSKGALDKCYIISENSKFDMLHLPIIEATEKLFNSGISFFISCIPGKLVYYEGEDRNAHFLIV